MTRDQHDDLAAIARFLHSRYETGDLLERDEMAELARMLRNIAAGRGALAPPIEPPEAA